MAKRRGIPAANTAPPPGAAIAAPPQGSAREVNLLVAVAALLCLAVAYLSRGALNPDGVSYLDLAAAARRGDWAQFAQGYWSPLFPLILATISWVTGLAGTSLVAAAHAVNLAAALTGLWILRRWGRAVPFFGRAAVAAFMICSAGLPRIEAVTPDVLLLAIAIGLAHELLVHGGRRGFRAGALFGLAFLAKTSAWPWLIIAIALRFWASRGATARRSWWGTTLVCAGVMLLWIIPMSLRAGHPTLGSAGSLNYSWYIDANSSRLPDTDGGDNKAYRATPVGNGQEVTVATFDDAARWTYQPWGDPTAWASNVLTETGRAPSAVELTGYWARQMGRVFGLWLLPLILAILVPAGVLHNRPRMMPSLMTTQRDALVVMILGIVGLLQFVAVHAEPRLIAPFGMMLALGALSWCCAAPAERPLIAAPVVQRLVGWLGVASALAFAAPKLIEGVHDSARLRQVEAQLATLKGQIASTGQASPEIAIVGPAAPVLSAAYWIGVHVGMQIPPHSADLLATLPASRQAGILMALFNGRTPVIWQTSADGGLKMLVAPAR